MLSPPAESSVRVSGSERAYIGASKSVVLLHLQIQCVPLAAKVDAAKKFFWANICVSSAVFKNKNLKYVFRAQVHSDTYGLISPEFLAHYSKERFGVDAKDLKVAIIHEDGPYGSGMAEGNA